MENNRKNMKENEKEPDVNDLQAHLWYKFDLISPAVAEVEVCHPSLSEPVPRPNLASSL